MPPLPVLIVGAGNRADLYARLLAECFAAELVLVGFVSRGEARARDAAQRFDVPWATAGDLEDAAFRWGAAGAVICPSSDANATMARRVAAQGLPFLLETPPSLDVAEAESLRDFVAAQGVAVEVAEQNPRGPEAGFAREAVGSGKLGDVRLAACDLAGYRYHATAVGRALLGRPRGRRASALRTVVPGLPPHAASIVAGTIEAEGGRMLQLRESEGIYLPNSPWRSGGWSVYGSRGSLVRDELCIGGTVERVRYESAQVGSVSFTASVACGEVIWTAGRCDAALDDDARAVAACLDDWLARIDGRPAPRGWSLADAVDDLRWIVALERSATLGGAPVTL